MEQGNPRQNPRPPAEAERSRPLADDVLRMIWQERRISRAEIARRATLSRSTVSGIVNQLLPTGLVAEIGEGESAGGRRPIVLGFQDDACVVLGVEMGANHVAVALTDLRGHVLHWVSRDHPVRSDPEGTRALIAELCQECLDTPAGRSAPLMGIGVAVACPVDPTDQDRISKVVLPEWNGHLGLDFLAEQLGAPVLVDNDANLGALAEHWWGAGRSIDHLAYIKVATGIGSGHIIGGEIYRGATGVAGEIGHIAVDPQGPTCVCGLRGCLVTLAGGNALAARARELAPEYPGSTFAAGVCTIAEIEDAALEGDPLALRIVGEAAGHLGTVLAGLLNLMNPSMVVLGGDLARLGDILLEPLRAKVDSRTLVGSVASGSLQTSRLGLQSIAIGASTMVLKAALDDARWFPSIQSAAASS